MIIGPRARSLIASGGYEVKLDGVVGVAAIVQAPDSETDEDLDGFAEGLRALGYKAATQKFALLGKMFRRVTFWGEEVAEGVARAEATPTPRPMGAYSLRGPGASFIPPMPRFEAQKPPFRSKQAIPEKYEAPAVTSDNPLTCRTCGADLGLVMTHRADGTWQCRCGAEVAL